jgi:hypothetical protein
MAIGYFGVVKRGGVSSPSFLGGFGAGVSHSQFGILLENSS